MILTCPQCQSQYNLDPDKLGVSGRVVRCVSCSHTWFQTAEPTKTASATEQAPQQLAPTKKSMAAEPTATVGAMGGKDAEIFDAILSKLGIHVSPAPSPSTRQEISPTVITHNPLGVNANAFGALTFFLCSSVTLLVVFLGQKPIVSHWPQTTLLYKTLGFHPKLPGEGLRISEVVAEHRANQDKTVLVVEGKITNMNERTVAYPPLHVVLKNDQLHPIKEWEIRAESAKLTSGETMPVVLQLKGAPPEGSIVEMHVSGN
ncbi:MAG: zinc-ribbon domain-containing protein [Proteobacteria bacterium]|nr:zinc-ribbon domain-containing protein [Pseudomonadota bacterium]